ncbi:hypothetical protein [Methylovulum psychrotolerans]|nr:hypothetical protein [Methylovulum psychrotolerans]
MKWQIYFMRRAKVKMLSNGLYWMLPSDYFDAIFNGICPIWHNNAL